MAPRNKAIAPCLVRVTRRAVIAVLVKFEINSSHLFRCHDLDEGHYTKAGNKQKYTAISSGRYRRYLDDESR